MVLKKLFGSGGKGKGSKEAPSSSSKSKGKGIAISSASEEVPRRRNPPRGVSIRSSPPRSPQNQPLMLPGPDSGSFHMPYPFDEPLVFSNAVERKRSTRFSKFEVITNLYPDEHALEEMDFLTSVKRKLCNAGFGFLFNDDPGTYSKLMLEFMSTFVPSWRDGDYNDAWKDKTEKFVTDWEFTLDGRRWKLSISELNDIFGIEGGGVPMLTAPYRSHFWGIITESDDPFVSPAPAAMIKLPLWKIIHRFVSMNVHIRKDGGRFVNSHDLDVMEYMYRTKAISLVDVITRQFVDYQSETYKGLALGGGVFITLIAKHLGFSLDGSSPLPKKILTMESLRRMRMIKADKKEWKVRTDAPKRIKERVSKRTRGASSSRAPSTRSPSPPPSPPHEPPTEPHHSPVPPFGNSNDYMGLCARMDRLEESTRLHHSRFEEHARFQYDYYSWQAKMTQDFFSHYGYSNYQPPPPHPFFPTHAAPPNYESGPSKSTTLDGVSTGEDEEDDIDIEGDSSDDGGDDGDAATDGDDVEDDDESDE